MPFFSIVIPTYNRAEELKVSLESVLQQTFTDFEVIVVDDGSTDDTSAVTRSFKDMRVRYVYQQNSERSTARNTGMQVADGKYICLLDSDDIFYPEHLEVLHEQIKADGEPIAIYKTMMHYHSGSRPDDLSYAYRGSDPDSALSYVWNNGSQLISLCFSNEIGKKILFPAPYFWFEDVHWITRVVSRYPLKQIMAHTTRYHNKSVSGIVKGNFKKYLDNCIACIRDLERIKGNDIKRLEGSNCFDKKIAELYLGFIVGGAIENKQIKLAHEYLRKAMATSITPKMMLKYGYYYMKLLKAAIS